jgi:hypothetical protein
MRLNSSCFNAATINAGSNAKPIVNIEGDSIIEASAGMVATRTVSIDGDAIGPVINVSTATQVQRFLSAGAIDFCIAHTIEASPSVYRSGHGASIIQTDANLFYVKQVYGYGSAILAISSKGDVGVRFGGGEAIIDDLLTATLDGAKHKRFAGAATMRTIVDLFPSAIRRPSVDRASIDGVILSELDPSAVSGGIKYVGMFGNTIIAVAAEDSGMLRQSFLGAVDIPTLMSAGTLTVNRPSLRGDAVINIVADMNGAMAIRNGHSVFSVLMLSEGECSIIVRGDGTAMLDINANLTGYMQKFALSGECGTNIEPELDGLRTVPIYGDTFTAVGVEGAGTILRAGSSECVIDTLSFSSGVVNADREDLDTHVFYKPGLTRELTKPTIERELYTKR